MQKTPHTHAYRTKNKLIKLHFQRTKYQQLIIYRLVSITAHTNDQKVALSKNETIDKSDVFILFYNIFILYIQEQHITF